MIKKIFIILISVLLFSCSPINLDIDNIKQDIQSILDQQKAAWNHGDLDGFMKFYWKSQDFTFQSGSNKRFNGWKELLSMYKANYSGKNMGKLDFKDIKIKVLSNNIVYVLGCWKVTRETDSKEGLFTLVFKKFNFGWKIIHDHSS